MPSSDPLQLTCQRHRTWLVTGEQIDLDNAPEITIAMARLRRTTRRSGADNTLAHYQQIHHHLTDEWRGERWHRLLVRRWTERQKLMHPNANANDEFVRAYTHHWSMLPETVTLLDG